MIRTASMVLAAGTLGERGETSGEVSGKSGEGTALPTGPFSPSTAFTMHLGGGNSATILAAPCTATSLP